MSEKQQIIHLTGILTEAGMTGRPTLEKCKEIKKRREFEAEMKEIDVSNIISEPRRSRTKVLKRTLIESSSEGESDESAEDSDDGSEVDDDGDNESDASDVSDSPASVSLDVSHSESESESTNVNWKSLGDPEDSD